MAQKNQIIYYKVPETINFFIPVYGLTLWENLGASQLLYSEDIHISVNIFQKIIVPVVYIAGCIYLGFLLAIATY